MAFNLQTLKTRALTSAVFVIVMALGVLLNNWSFFLLFSIIHFGCWLEFQKLAGLIDKDYTQITAFHKYGVMLAGWCIMLFFTNDSYTLGSLSLHAIGWWLGLIFVFLLPIIELLFSKEVILKNIGYSMLGLLYISLSWGLMMDLRNPHMLDAVALPGIVEKPWLIPVLCILCLWTNDTMAYLVGSWIGKTPFSSISPKKTWEGTMGGALLCILLITMVFQHVFHWKHLLVISSLAAIIGTIGDLFESKLKRMANVKDSGQLMPGHGGFLDRFDSLILATPFIWIYIRCVVS